MRRFDAADDHDADGYATTAEWLAARTRLGRNDAKAAVRHMRLLGRHPSLDAATATGDITDLVGEEIARLDRPHRPRRAPVRGRPILVEAAKAGPTSTT